MTSDTWVVNQAEGEECDAYIGRGSSFGNPWSHLPSYRTQGAIQVSTREEAIEKYKGYFYRRLEKEPGFAEQVEALRGKRLGCYCKPAACHGDVIVDYLHPKPEHGDVVHEHWGNVGGSYNRPKELWGVMVKGKPRPPTEEEVAAWHPPLLPLKVPRMTTYVVTSPTKATATAQYNRFVSLEPAHEAGNTITLVRSDLSWEEVNVDG